MVRNIIIYFITIFCFQISYAQVENVLDDDLKKQIQEIERLENQNVAVDEKLKLEFQYLQQLDQAINSKMEQYVSESLRTLQETSSAKEYELLQLQILKDEFFHSMKRYGMAKDFERFNAFYEYNSALRKVLIKTNNTKVSVLERLKKNLSSIKAGLRLLVPFMKLSFYTVFPELKDNKGTPLTNAADHFFSKVAINKNVSVQINGKGNIQQDLPAGEINIILSNHVSADNDAIVLSNLGLKSYITFGALNLKGEGIFSLATHSIFKSVLRRIDMQRDLILLGRKNDPLAKLVEVLKSQRTSNLFLFPQGMISLGFNETNPLKPLFSEKVIKYLQDQGFKINLHILSMPDNFDDVLSLERAKSNQTKTLRAIVSEVIRDDEIKSLFRERGSIGVDYFIRTRWIKDIRKFDPEYFGVLSEDEIRVISKGGLSCKRIFAN